MIIDQDGFEQARRRIAADVLELRAVKLRFKRLIASLELGYAQMAESIGVDIDTTASPVDVEPKFT